MSPRPASRTRPCNVLVIGTGGAGLRAAIAARQAGVDVDQVDGGIGQVATQDVEVVRVSLAGRVSKR